MGFRGNSMGDPHRGQNPLLSAHTRQQAHRLRVWRGQAAAGGVGYHMQ